MELTIQQEKEIASKEVVYDVKDTKFDGTHNKDYSVVKTFKAGLGGLAFFILTKVIIFAVSIKFIFMFLGMFLDVFFGAKIQPYFDNFCQKQNIFHFFSFFSKQS